MKTYLGVDVSKLHLDLSHPAPAKRLANTEKAILPWLKALPPETILVCEASGGYEALLLSLAQAAHQPIIQLNARQVRDFARAKNRLAKTDRIDAGLIADFAQTFQPKPLSRPDPLQEQLLALVKHRSDLLTQITQNNNLTQTLTDKNLLRLIAKTVAFLQKQVAQLEALMQTKLAASPALLAKVNRLRQVQGIGVLTATSLVALMPELGSLTPRPPPWRASLPLTTTVVSSAVSATSLVAALKSARSFTWPRSSPPATTLSLNRSTSVSSLVAKLKNSLSLPSCERSSSSLTTCSNILTLLLPLKTVAGPPPAPAQHSENHGLTPSASASRMVTKRFASRSIFLANLLRAAVGALQ